MSGMLTLRCLPLLQGGSNGGLLMGAVLNQVSHLLPAEKLSCHDGLCVFPCCQQHILSVPLQQVFTCDQALT